jgi:hypothetical protein
MSFSDEIIAPVRYLFAAENLLVPLVEKQIESEDDLMGIDKPRSVNAERSVANKHDRFPADLIAQVRLKIHREGIRNSAIRCTGRGESLRALQGMRGLEAHILY